MRMLDVKGRDIAALLNPRPVVLITCCDRAGMPNVLSVAWTTPVSHEPPIIAVSIAPNRYSHSSMPLRHAATVPAQARINSPKQGSARRRRFAFAPRESLGRWATLNAA
jgi:hypothetical protein